MKNVYKFYLSKSVGPTAGLLQGLTVMQKCLYQITFRNVYKFNKRLAKSGLVWSRTLSTLLSINKKSSLCLYLHNGLTFWARLLQTVDKRNNLMKCHPMRHKCNQNLSCALLKLSNDTTLGKNEIFRWFWFPQIVQKQTLGEVES